jgi:type IV secretion system protein VirD4
MVKFDSVLLLGGKVETTFKDLFSCLDKETINLCNNSETRGRERSYGTNYQKVGKELMKRDLQKY